MCAYDTTVADAIDPPESRTGHSADRHACLSSLLPRLDSQGFAIVAALCFVFLATSFYRLNHTDLWGHINFGRWIVEHGQLPIADPFGAQAAEQGFVNVPWLSQVLGYRLVSMFGLEGLALAHVMMVTLSCAVLMLAVHRRGVSPVWSVAAGIAAYLLSLPVAGTIRPQLFGMYLFPLVLLSCLMLEARRGPLLWLPCMFALWANLHGSFAVGLAVLAMYCLASTWESMYRSYTTVGPRQSARRYWLALALCLAACCLNPLGPKLLLGVASFGSHEALQNISEWRALRMGTLSGALFFFSIGATAVLLRYSKRPVRLVEVLLLVLFAVATLSAMRMLTWWALVWPFVIAPHAMSVWNTYRGRRRCDGAKTNESATLMRGLTALAAVFMALLLAPPSHGLISGRERGEGAVVSRGTPLYLADELNRRQIQGNVFAPMDWADYLVWKNPGRIRPLVYTHVHLLEPNTWRGYLTLSAGETGWLETAEQFNIEYLALDRDRNARLLSAAIASPRVQLVYQDQQSALLRIGAQ